jgi:hypothetical protein
VQFFGPLKEDNGKTNKMKMLKTMPRLILVMTSVGLLPLTGKVNANPVTVVAGVDDRPAVQAQFLIDNPTDRTIKYFLRWGESGQWKLCVLEPSFHYTHSHNLNAGGEFPAPHVRFDDASGNQKAYHMRCASDSSSQYEFKYDASGQHLDLYKKN